MKGTLIRTIRELMWHKTIQMTVRYAHLAPQHTLAAVERLCEPVEAESNEEVRFRGSFEEAVAAQEVPSCLALSVMTGL